MTLGVVDTSNVPDEGRGRASSSGYVCCVVFRDGRTQRAFSQHRSWETAVRHLLELFCFYRKSSEGSRCTNTQAVVCRFVKEEIAKLQTDSETRALVDDPDVVVRGKRVKIASGRSLGCHLGTPTTTS